jgi:hypothetical protein
MRWPHPSTSQAASTGGLWSQLLTERHRELLEAVLSLCGYQVGSAVPWNLGLDFGFTVKTLPPEAWNRQLPL